MAQGAIVDTSNESHYAFERGFPTDETIRQAYDDADLNRAVQAYKFFYPTVSGAAIVRGAKVPSLFGTSGHNTALMP